MRPFRPVLLLALCLLAAGAANAQEIRCQSRNFQYQFCPSDGEVIHATLARQESQAACVRGRTWGWSNNGVWVSNGCSGRFLVETFRPLPPWSGGDRLRCDSRNFQYEFCFVPQRVFNVDLVRQTSSSACVLGRTWGWREDGVWVNNGCQGEFRVQTQFVPAPPVRPGLTFCASRSFRYNFCETGPISGAQMITQRSQAPCLRGRSWGTTPTGIWVDNGCAANFRITPRW
jgi:Protein of unknown function (DUF3011)